MNDSLISMVSGIPAKSYMPKEDRETTNLRARRSRSSSVKSTPPQSYRSVSQADISQSAIPADDHQQPPARGFFITYLLTQLALVAMATGLVALTYALVKLGSPLLYLFAGMLIGGFLMYTALYYYTWLLNPEVVTVQIPPIDVYEYKVPEDAVKYLPRNPNASREESIYSFQGWLNLLEGQEYRAEAYHISNTEPVYAHLEGCSLRLKKPLEADVPKRATWNEPTHNVTFIKQIQVDVRNFSMELPPSELPEGKRFGKRFPICLVSRRSSQKQQRDGGRTESLFEKYHASTKRLPDTIVVFARTGREKEEWYRRLDQASRGFSISTLVLELQRLAELGGSDACATSGSDSDRVDCKGRRRSWSDSVDFQRASLKRKKQRLYDRDHKILLTYYMKYMTKVLSKASRLDHRDGAAKSPKLLTPPPETRPQPSSNGKDKTSRKSLSPSRITSGVTSFFSSKSPPAQLGVPGSTATKQPTLDPGASQDPLLCDTGTMWVNALIHRIFFDFFFEDYWSLKVQSKIQKKLNKINVPYYLGKLTVSEVHQGSGLPFIKRISEPYLSDDGMWIDCDLFYTGGAVMTIETKINLNALRQQQQSNTPKSSKIFLNKLSIHRADDSDDSSTDSEEAVLKISTPLDKDPKRGEHTLTKFFNLLKDSRYFQRLAETRLVKSALDKMSNTKFRLTVELKFLSGIFSINIAPPPTDRIWYAFRGPPHVVLSAKPVIGAKSVNLVKLTDWIERKLITEFHRELVLPNMHSARIKVMVGNYRATSVAADKRESQAKKSRSTSEAL